MTVYIPDQHEEEQPQISSTSFLASPLQRLSDLARGQSEGIHAQTAAGNLRLFFAINDVHAMLEEVYKYRTSSVKSYLA